MITYRDLSSGERMELSAASLDNAVAKTAGLLRDDLDAGPGTVVGVHLPLHWQRVVWLGACAATGAVFASEADPAACDILVVDRDRLHLAGTARDDVLVSLAPFGLPEPEGAPTGVVEAATAMRAHPDVYVPDREPSADAALLARAGHTVTHAGAMESAARVLTARGVPAGARFALIDPDPDSDLLCLAGPLALGGSVVLVSHADAGDLQGALLDEGITAAGG